MRPNCRPLAKTEPDPDARDPPWQIGFGSQWTAQPSPCRWAGIPLTRTLPEPPVLFRGGNSPCPVQLSPCRVTPGISSG